VVYGMLLEDYLLPGEEIRSHSNRSITYGGNPSEMKALYQQVPQLITVYLARRDNIEDRCCKG
jgi:UDP:flavonoid glycosyltransferase YjiC (YdhE family)